MNISLIASLFYFSHDNSSCSRETHIFINPVILNVGYERFDLGIGATAGISVHRKRPGISPNDYETPRDTPIHSADRVSFRCEFSVKIPVQGARGYNSWYSRSFFPYVYLYSTDRQNDVTRKEQVCWSKNFS